MAKQMSVPVEEVSIETPKKGKKTGSFKENETNEQHHQYQNQKLRRTRVYRVWTK
jgi:hypothetical protein